MRDISRTEVLEPREPLEEDLALEPAPAIDLRQASVSAAVDLSVVIPLYNEWESLEELHSRLAATLQEMGRTYEILFVDDGSIDQSPEKLQELVARDPRVRVYTFRRNLGKAAALSVGFERARGASIVTMDADLQDEPAEIPRFLAKLDEGYDLVSGWKKKRLDPVGKTLPSRLFNWTTRKMTGLSLHDFNCGFKAYRRPVVRRLNLYGELHRYIPALAYWKGFRVGEIAVEHHPRIHGKSKYGWERFVRGMFDLITVVFLTRYTRKPLHFFGSAGLLLFLGGLATGAYLTYLHFQGVPIHDRPLLVLAVLLMILGAQFVSTGLIAELIVSQRGFVNYDDYLVDETE
ncbi:MAG TPA: glycosyltransferase [Armatimonadota bacterium]|nr:glycosyltransferase [Armatimonadota bacterium]